MKLASLLLSAALLIAPPALLAAEPRFDSATARAQYHAMVGELAALRDQPALAASEFLKALDEVPDPGLAMRAAALSLAAHDEPLARRATRRWMQLDPSSADAREASARLALRAGDRGETLQLCEAIVRARAPALDEGFRAVAILLSQESEHRDDALAVMEQLRRKWPDSAAALHSQGMLAMRFNDLALAEKAARDALKITPDARDTQLLLAAVMVRQNRLADADAVMAALLKGSKEPAELRMAYARLLLEADHPVEARRQFEAVLAAKSDSAEARYAAALVAVQQEDYAAAETHLKKLLGHELLGQAAAFYLGRVAEARKQPQQAMDWYAQVTRGDLAIDAVVRRARLLAKSGKLDEGRSAMQQLREQIPQLAPRFYLAEAEMLVDANRLPEALQLYQRALAERPDDPELLYGLSLVHDRMGQGDAAEADLRRILKGNPDDSRALNALGYMITEHGSRYDEARKLIARALELTPDDAAVIDSMGWVEYQLGHLQDARTLLEKAFGKARDPEIAAHLGEVLWRLGDQGAARTLWQDALKRDPEHKVLRQTVERLDRK
ncbi:MAG TPA: tetratricopeptide repeat protein [Candidatus Binatia bacterium]|nr:tetratricopeptide repeat protein [Candidatus Binatia bacterium]